MHSIRGKILAIVISFLLILCLAFSVYSLITTANYKRLRVEALVSRVQFESERLNRSISVMEQEAVGLANAGRAYYSYARHNDSHGKKILLFSIFIVPYAWIQYYPFLYLLGQRDSVWYVVLPLGACWFLIPAWLLWRTGVKRYQSSGS